MPPTPWSPMPRMPSESVATSRSTSSAPRPVLRSDVLDVLGVVDGQVDPARAAELVAEPLDRLPDGRGVDDRQHLLEVLGQQPVEQHLVAVAQVGQVDALGQIVRLPAVLRVDPPQLAVQRQTPRGQQPVQARARALVRGERRAAVDHRVREDRPAASADPERIASLSREPSSYGPSYIAPTLRSTFSLPRACPSSPHPGYQRVVLRFRSRAAATGSACEGCFGVAGADEPRRGRRLRSGRQQQRE